MGNRRLDIILGTVRRASVAPAASGVTDAELLHRFVKHRDEAAFELLLWRHQRMVFGVCKHLLHDVADAEEVFQATFLTLVCKAHSIAQGESVAAWLHQVARRAAGRAAARRARRLALEKPAPDLPAVAVASGPLTAALQGELDGIGKGVGRSN
jgi:DNA-directed RNA polymerase specialized sigma24 family protein